LIGVGVVSEIIMGNVMIAWIYMNLVW